MNGSIQKINGKPKLYKLNDDLLFRLCTLYEGPMKTKGDCTAYWTSGDDDHRMYNCEQEGIHFHCAKHPHIELVKKKELSKEVLYCPKCELEYNSKKQKKDSSYSEDSEEFSPDLFNELSALEKPNYIKFEGAIHDLVIQCQKAYQETIFKDAELIRLDDIYVPCIKLRPTLDNDYWMEAKAVKDKNNNTVVTIYVGKKSDKFGNKAQIFINHDRKQLSFDYKDKDPAELISEIKVTLSDRVLIQKFGSDD